ncbi:hypothetical protein BQ8482_380081 [Mesorhizobium delmotii]|uniref:Uncharacterized protein n=1 Tax=Mesorhizobium delmotii TaxID=1631247 RepID=A0A2P9ARV2_9HYPH|nr:hypothetical protein BQ8482_380081 [Mesorhizobium delmotii]
MAGRNRQDLGLRAIFGRNLIDISGQKITPFPCRDGRRHILGMAIERLAGLRGVCHALGHVRIAIDVVEQLGVAGITSGLVMGPPRERILKKVLQDRVVLHYRYQCLPNVGMNLGTRRAEVRRQTTNDLGGVLSLLDLLVCRVENERKLYASSFERFAMMLELSSRETGGDHLGSNQTFAIKDGFHRMTP